MTFDVITLQSRLNMATLIKEVRLIMAENGIDAKTGKPRNNYKFWVGKLYDDDMVHANWGRVGETGDSGEWAGGQSYLDKKIKEKFRKGYTEQKTMGESIVTSTPSAPVNSGDLHSIAKSQLIKSSNPTLERLITRFVNANVHKITSSTQITYNSNTGLFTTPLGIVTMDGLVEARDLLADLAPLVRKQKFGTEADAILCKYLRIIPQSLGMKRFSTETVVPDDNALQKQMDLIDSLESSYQATQTAATPVKTVTTQEQVFKVDLDVLTDQAERARLDRYFETSKKRMHGYDNVKVREIFKVTIHDMANGFERKTTPIKEVFHGSSSANSLSILKSGLRVSPPSTAAIAGKLYGNGVYGSTCSSKSMGYTFGRWSQGCGDMGYLWICDFALGSVFYPKTYSATKPSGYDSIWAKPENTGLNNDELIVYKNSQVNIKYLVEIK